MMNIVKAIHGLKMIRQVGVIADVLKSMYGCTHSINNLKDIIVDDGSTSTKYLAHTDGERLIIDGLSMMDVYVSGSDRFKIMRLLYGEHCHPGSVTAIYTPAPDRINYYMRESK